MKICLTDMNVALTDAWRRLADPSIVVRHGSIFDEPVEAVVSPANSFGFMDGGIDLAYSRQFGWDVQRRVQDAIRKDFDGEMLVGQALSVDTGDPLFPHLISAPTMRVPMVIADPQAVRLATRAAAREALRRGYASIAIPGMGTGSGRVKEDWAAPLMLAGIRDALYPQPFPRSLHEAHADHFKDYGGRAERAA